MMRLPDGRTVSVRAPVGLRSGDTFRMCVPPSTEAASSPAPAPAPSVTDVNHDPWDDDIR